MGDGGRRSEVGSGSDERRALSARRLPPTPVVLVTDGTRLRVRRLVDVVDAAVDGGVNIVQLRDRAANHEALLRDARELRDVTRGRALLFVNTDLDAAIASGADGVHLPEGAGAIAEARARAGAAMLISRAVHSVEAALAAEREGVDVVQAGTLFSTASKPGGATLGVDGLRAICDAVRIPVIAIGGITVQNAALAIGAGAAGVAVIGAVFDAPDPRQAAASLRSALDAAIATAGAR